LNLETKWKIKKGIATKAQGRKDSQGPVLLHFKLLETLCLCVFVAEITFA